MKIVGCDNLGNELKIGDMCSFKINNTDLEGRIIYNEENFSFAFEMKGERFPMVLMQKADLLKKQKKTPFIVLL